MQTDSSSNQEMGGKKISRGWKILLWVVGILLAFVLLIIGCLFLYVSVMSRSLARDCYWEADALAFEDVNADGIYQAEETLLEGVQLSLFVYYKGGGQKGPESQFVTGKDGKVNVGTGLPGCPDVTFKLISQTPEGYELTTPGTFETENYVFEDPIPFGFMKKLSP